MEYIDKALQKLKIHVDSPSSLTQDMQFIASHCHNPFVKDNVVNVEAYIEFVCQYNEFINHEPKQFKPLIDKDMTL